MEPLVNANFPRRTLSIIGVSLLLVAGAACGSDSKSDSTTAATSAGVATTSASATDATLTTKVTASTDATGTDDDGLDSVPLPTATDDREAIVEYVGNIAEAAGIEYDEECVTDLVAKLSDADAALLADSARHGGEGDPQLSSEGEAIGTQVEGCAVESTTTTG